MTDSFEHILTSTSSKQKGKKFLLMYYIINPDIYNKDNNIDIGEDISSIYPVGTYDSYKEAFCIMTGIMKNINIGKFKIIKIGSGGILSNKKIDSSLNDYWNTLDASRLLEIDKAEKESQIRKDQAEDIQKEQEDAKDESCIDYLRDNFSNLCFNLYALDQLHVKRIQLEESIEARRNNCRKYIINNGNESLDQLNTLYKERLPKRGEEQLIGFFTEKLMDKIDGIPRILHKN